MLEAGKVPSLRRRGQVEQLMMSALEAGLIEDFIAPLVGGKPIGEWPGSAPFVDSDGTAYHVSIERGATGTRLTIRRGGARRDRRDRPRRGLATPATRAAGLRPRPPGSPESVSASPQPRRRRHPRRDRRGGPRGPSPSRSSQPAAGGPGGAGRRGPARPARPARHPHPAARAPAVALAREHGASDVLISSRQPPRMRIDGRLEPLDLHIDDATLAACVDALIGDAGSVDLGMELISTPQRLAVARACASTRSGTSAATPSRRG